MRGTHRLERCRIIIIGIIPAYAGNTPAGTMSDYYNWDHPRVCGEHLPDTLTTSTPKGSSPRMRGTLYEMNRKDQYPRIIPAYAGNTGLQWLDCKTCLGSSPRMRGTLCGHRYAAHHYRIIPAYAGNTLSLMGVDCRLRDHPRVCGEHSGSMIISSMQMGSSPRMRGTHRTV